MVANLKKLRTAHGISQQKLAEAVGVSQQSINKYENHTVEPNIETLVLFADYFGVSVDHLIGRTDGQFSPPLALTGEEGYLVARWRTLNEADKAMLKNLLERLSVSAT